MRTEELASGLDALADDVTNEDADRLCRAVRRRRARVRRRALAFGAGAATAIVAVGGLSVAGVLDVNGGKSTSDAASSEHPDPGVRDDFQQLELEPGEACPAAEKTQLDRLSAEFDGLWVPDHPLASPNSLRQAWLCGGAPLLEFDHIEIYFEDGWHLKDPEARWSAMAEQWGAGHVETVHGVPAFVLPRSEMGPLGQVSLVLDSTYVRIHGDGTLPVEKLVDVAETLTPAVP